MPDSSRPRRIAAAAGGAGLAAATRMVATARRADKPLHPRGDLVTAVLRRDGGPTTGSAFLDEAGVSEGVLCRRSRAVGLPATLPDIHGLALRIPLAAGSHGDLLLAGTGTGRLTRFLLLPGRHPDSRALTTLLPYRSPTGPRLLGAVAVSPVRYDLVHARPGGRWERFGELLLSDRPGSDPLTSFDPVRHPLPGLDTYDWVRRLREPAYATARRSRS